MKVFIIAKSKRHTRIYYYFKKAFQRLGHQAHWVKYLKLKSYLGERAATAFVDRLMLMTKPDLLFFHGRDISYELLLRAKKRMPVVMYYDDCIKGSSRSFEEVIKQDKINGERSKIKDTILALNNAINWMRKNKVPD